MHKLHERLGIRVVSVHSFPDANEVLPVHSLTKRSRNEIKKAAQIEQL